MRLRYGSSFWLRRSISAKRPRHPPLQREINVDVAIVGGGFTGCAAALIFAQAGVRVAVLEEAQLGHGSAAASTALLMQEPDRYFTELAKRHGRSTAETIWRLSRRGVEDLTSTLERLKCGLRPTPSLHLALDRDRARDLRRDIAARRRAGLGGRLLEPSGLRRRTGIEGAAAILSSGNAVVDPYRATLALAREAGRDEALFFERSAALRVTRSVDGVVIRTRRGLVRADCVIVATGFATPAFRPLRARFTMSTTYVIATSPVPGRLRRHMANGHLMFWDAVRPYHYFRWTDDGRILFGGEDRPVPKGSRARRAALAEASEALRRQLVQIYPAASELRIDHAWEGLFATTPDGLPYVGPHRRYPRHLFALGYGGNGMTFAFPAARILLRNFLGRLRPEDTVFSFARGRR